MRRALLLALVSLSIPWFPVDNATAGTYQAETCTIASFAAGLRYGLQFKKVPAGAPFLIRGPECADHDYSWALPGIWGNGNNYTKNQRIVMSLNAPTGSAFVGTVKVDRSTSNVDSPYYPNSGRLTAVSGLSNGNGSDWIVGNPPAEGGGDVVWIPIPYGQRRTTLEGRLECTYAHCNNALGSLQFGNVRVTIDDFTNPQVAVAGNIIYPGTLSGTKTLTAIGIDGQSGLKGVLILVNDHLTTGVDTCPSPNIGFNPCPVFVAPDIAMDTTQPPFHNGLNTIQACYGDYSGNGFCDNKQQITVQN